MVSIFAILWPDPTNISSIEKPLIALFCYFKHGSLNYLSSILDVLFEFDAYHRARYQFKNSCDVSRDAMLDSLLGVHVKDMLTWFLLKDIPYIPEELDGVYRNKLVRTHVMRLMQENKTWVVNEFETARKVQQMAWMPDQLHYEIYDYMLTNHCIDPKRSLTLIIIILIIMDVTKDSFLFGVSTKNTVGNIIIKSSQIFFSNLFLLMWLQNTWTFLLQKTFLNMQVKNLPNFYSTLHKNNRKPKINEFF